MAKDFSLAAFSSQLAELVERASAFVVSVDGRPRRPASGIVLGPDLVVTAEHVLERDDDIHVTAGGDAHDATIAGRDPASDVAVLRVPGLKGAEPPRADGVRIGEFVLSISRTGGGGVSAGAGIVVAVSGPLRTGYGVVLPQVIRTDAAARPGTSGGAIVDASGRVIGMTTTVLLRGLPVAIPSAHVWQIANTLLSHRGMRRGYLGVHVHPVRLPERQQPAAPQGTPGRAERGLLVLGLAREGAADRAGVLVGDVIVAFNGKPAVEPDDLQDALATVEAGASATLDVVRAGALQRVNLTVGERPNR